MTAKENIGDWDAWNEIENDQWKQDDDFNPSKKQQQTDKYIDKLQNQNQVLHRFFIS